MIAKVRSADPNVAQRGAADPSASVWVAASAGTGKTKVLTDRVLRLLLVGTPPERILCLTFTKAAAAEMNIRLAGVLANWAAVPDADLKQGLRDVLDRAPSKDELGLARCLFARVLDVPGGMRILTIHAFCQTVLGRFPIEAGIAPHFQVLDERDQNELLVMAQRRLLAAAEHNPVQSAALAEVGRHADESMVGELFRAVAGDRHELAAALAHFGSPEAVAAATAAAFGLEPAEDPESVLAAACSGRAFDDDGLRRAAAALQCGSRTDRERGALIVAWLAASPDERRSSWLAYTSVFLTANTPRTVRARMVTKDARVADPAAEGFLQEEANRLLAVLERWHAAVVVAASRAVVHLGADLLARYEALKRARAVLDFDDLIDRAADLLEGEGGASWVLYKLDGGIDHVLIDEAQDTSPRQWRVILGLTSEFFAGAGARDEDRTVFAVGDVKQSIFGFQGADPLAFLAARDGFGERVPISGGTWRPISLEASFRSTRAVLGAVDAVFRRPEASDGVALDGTEIMHQAFRLLDGGSVELWPPVAARATDTPAPWSPPIERVAGDSPETRLAVLLAERIRHMIATEQLESKGRPVCAGDIMVLVRRRGPFVEDLVRRLKERGVPVAGVDRMVLTEQMAVMDLMALGRFALLPEDDLTLAAVLKGPFVGLNEDQLFRLAYERPGTLWAALVAAAGSDAAFEDARAKLTSLRALADTVTPFDFYAHILGPLEGRRRLLARLGREAEDPISEFVDLALTYERMHPPSLQGFLHWVERTAVEVKRDLEQEARNAVRVLTVHGAKGLQAPIVVLPDTMRAPTKRPMLTWIEPHSDHGSETSAGRLPIWLPRAEHSVGPAERARDTAAESQSQEYRRLLYVAMTRAEDRLIVCGWRGTQAESSGCWYRLIEAGLKEGADENRIALEIVEDPFLAAAPEIDDFRMLRVRCPQETPKAEEPAPKPSNPELPPWARAPGPAEPVPPRPLAPSRPRTSEPPVSSPLSTGMAAPVRRGRLIHRLLQSLPDHPTEARARVARDWLARPTHGLASEDREEIAAAALSTLGDPACAAVFAPGGRAEVPISGVVAGRVISGQVDRLLISEGEISVLDFKTDRSPPIDAASTPSAYLHQMAAYRSLLREIYPDRPVRCLLVWTDGPVVTTLDDALLDRHAPSVSETNRRP